MNYRDLPAFEEISSYEMTRIVGGITLGEHVTSLVRHMPGAGGLAGAAQCPEEAFGASTLGELLGKIAIPLLGPPGRNVEAYIATRQLVGC